MEEKRFLESSYPQSVKLIFSLVQKILSEEWGFRLLEETATFSPAVFNTQIAFSLFLIENFFQDRKEVELFQNLREDPLYFLCKEECLTFSKEALSLVLLGKEEKSESLLVLKGKIFQLVASLPLPLEIQEFFLEVFKETAEHFFLLIGTSRKVLTPFYIKDLNKMNEKKYSFVGKEALEKTLSICVDTAIEKGDKSLSKKTVSVLNKIKPSSEKNQLINILFSQVFKNTKNSFEYSLERILYFIDQMPEKEKPVAFERLVLFLAKNEKEDLAYRMTKKIQDPEIKDYTLSALVQRLSQKGGSSLLKGQKISKEIKDLDYLEDAFSALVKSYLNQNSFYDALNFVKEVDNLNIRAFLVKILQSGAIASKKEEWKEAIHQTFKI